MDFLTYLQQRAVASQQPQIPYVPGLIAGKSSGRGYASAPSSIMPAAQPEVDPNGPYQTGVSGVVSDIMGGVGKVIPGHGVGLGILDLMMRPSYAANNVLQDAARADNPMEAISRLYNPLEFAGQAWQGLSGQQKVAGADVVDEVSQDLGKDPSTLNRPLRGSAGTAIDIFADPTTYVGVGLIGKIAKLAGLGKVGEAVAETAPELAAAETKTLEQAATEASTNTANKLAGSAKDKVSSKPWDSEEVPVPASPEVSKYTNLKNAAKNVPPVETPIVDAAETASETARRVLSSTEVGPGFKFIPPTPQIVEQIANYDLPIPFGQSLAEDASAKVGWATPSSTHLYPFAGSKAIDKATGVIDNSHDFLDIIKNAKGVEPLKKAYEEGRIRPPKDTPAESELMHQIQIQEAMDIAKRASKGGRTSKDVKPSPLDFFSHDSIDRGFFTAGTENIAAPVISVRVAGETVDMTTDQLWKTLHGKPATLTDGTEVAVKDVSIRSRANPNKWTPAADVAANNARALNSEKFWGQATHAAKQVVANPKTVANKIMKQQVAFIQSAKRTSIDYLEEWRKAAKASSPALSTESLNAAYDIARKILDDAYAKMQQGVIRHDERAFFNGAVFANKVKSAMASAIARNANPEELVADVATIKHESDVLDMQGLAAIVETHIKDMQTKSAIGSELAQKLDEADALLAEVNKAEDVAKVERMDLAQTATGDVSEKVRQAANANGISPSAQATIDASNFAESTTLSADKAIGLVKSSTSQVIERMSAKQPYYEAAAQAGVVNNILKNLGEGSKVVRSILFGRGGTKTAVKVTNIIRATERNIEELDGSLPTVWNKAYGPKSGKKGFPVGKPGVLGEVTVTKPANHGLSSADLLDKMIQDSKESILAGKGDPQLAQKALFGMGKGNARAHWTDILHAALFKDPVALGRVKQVDETLHDWLLNFDPAEDIRKIDTIRTNKLTSNVEAQTSKAVEHTADSVVNKSPARAAKETADAGNVAKKSIERVPGTPVSNVLIIKDTAQVVADKTKNALEPADVVTRSVEANKNKLMKAVTGADIAGGNKAARSVTKASGVLKAVDGKTISDAAFNAAWVKKLATMFRTNYGAQITRPIMQSAFDRIAALMSGSYRQWEAVQTVLKKLPDNEGVRVIKALNPKIGAQGLSPEAMKVYEHIRKTMEQSFGGSGLEAHIAGNSSAGIAGLTRGNLNAWLSSKRVLGADGKLFRMGDGTTGAEWLNGWEEAAAKFDDTDKATHFLHNLEQAVYAATTERSFYDDLAVRFGGEGLYTAYNPYLKGIGFHEDLAPQINQIETLVEALKHPKTSGPILKSYDQVLRLWKTGRTIYTPTHHIRNVVGDTWLLYADGGKFRHVTKAAKLMNKYRAANLDLGELGGSMRGVSLENAKDIKGTLEKILNPTEAKVSVTNKASGIGLDEEQIMASFNEEGLAQSAGMIEDIMESSDLTKNLPGRLTAPFGGKVHHAVATGAEAREHTIRLGHYLHALETTVVTRPKGMGLKFFKENQQKLLIEQAAMRVRKLHPDGMDMTEFERKVMRRFIPFYSWSRKSIPLILLTGVRRPGLVTAYPKLETGFTNAFGNEGNNPLNGYLPGDQLFDVFSLSSPTAVAGTSLEDGGSGYTTMSGPSTPPIDFLTQLTAPKRELLGMLSPAISLPSELVNGTYFGTDISMDGGDKAKAIAQNVVPGPYANWASSNNTLKNNILNALLGLGLRDTGTPGYQKSAQYALLDRIKAGENQ